MAPKMKSNLHHNAWPWFELLRIETPQPTATGRDASAHVFMHCTNQCEPGMKFRLSLFGLLAVLLVNCGGADRETPQLNGLANETSVYLKRHARNPVNWQPWSDVAFETARELDRLVIVSSGYMACHWCHVMERESFSNDSIAAFMNDHFVCIKVDREERPDVDQAYLDAVELISGRAGWPLNCITLPDGRPVYGGTYFAPEDWYTVLTRINALYREDRSKLESIANELTAGLTQLWSIEPTDAMALPIDSLMTERVRYFDAVHGGDLGNPKFILPGDLSYLLHYGHLRDDDTVLKHIAFTLERLPMTGVYDAVGGGFFRYTVDEAWEVPHFEKMLYDNALLVDLYSDAYRWSGNEAYRTVVEETIDFVLRELMAPDGSFYSSLDADSQGEEGRYYSFTQPELTRITAGIEGADSIVSASHIEPGGEALAIRIHPVNRAEGWSPNEQEAAQKVKAALDLIRQRREAPQTDTKILTSWNALMIRALCNAWRATGDDRYLDAARRACDAVLAGAFEPSGELFHTRTGKTATVLGLLDDYGYLLEALCEVYACTWDERYLEQATRVAQAIALRFDATNGVFNYRQSENGALPGTPPNVNDNVVPSANAAVASGFFMLGTLTAEPDWIRKASALLKAAGGKLVTAGGHHHWARLHLRLEQPFHAVVITGVEHRSSLRKSFDRMYLPQAVIIGGEAKHNPLLEGKPQGDTLIYVCKEGACRLPVKTKDDALAEME